MEYTLVYTDNDKSIKETFDFSTNPVFHQIFNLDTQEQELIDDFMILENEAAKYIKDLLVKPSVLYFSITNKERVLYHDFEDFFSKIY